jgi:hypothetical protein
MTSSARAGSAGRSSMSRVRQRRKKSKSLMPASLLGQNMKLRTMQSKCPVTTQLQFLLIAVAGWMNG